MRWIRSAAEGLRDAWSFVEPVVGVATTVFAILIWWQLRRARVRMRGGAAGVPTVINFSGHPIERSEDDWARAYTVCDLLPTFATTSSRSLAESASGAIAAIPDALRARLTTGDPAIVIAIPGLAPATAHILAAIHGLAGHFPRITYALPAPGGGYAYVAPIDLQGERLAAREGRRSAPPDPASAPPRAGTPRTGD